MNRRIFVAGVSGAIGRVLCRLLVADGWIVVGTTRSPDKADALRAIGVAPVIVDVYGLVRSATGQRLLLVGPAPLGYVTGRIAHENTADRR